MDEAADYARAKERGIDTRYLLFAHFLLGKLVVYSSYGTAWRKFGSPQEPRDISSIFLDRRYLCNSSPCLNIK